MHEVMGLEREAWQALSSDEAGAFFDRVLTDDAVMVVPGGTVLDRADALRSWDNVEPWSEYRLDDERVVELAPGAVLLTYRVTARRAGQPEPYRAVLTSVYVGGPGAWRLAFHQQTP